MLKVPTGLTVMPVLKNSGSGHGLLVLNTGSGSCEAANNATFTAAAVSSLVALRPTALSSRGLQSHFSLMLPAAPEDAKPTELGHVGASSILSFDVTRAGGH